MCLMTPHCAYPCRAASRCQLLLPSQHCWAELVPGIHTFSRSSLGFPVAPSWYQSGRPQCRSAKALTGCCGDGKRPRDEHTGGRRWQQIQAKEESSKPMSHSASGADVAHTSRKGIPAPQNSSSIAEHHYWIYLKIINIDSQHCCCESLQGRGWQGGFLSPQELPHSHITQLAVLPDVWAHSKTVKCTVSQD